MGVITTVGIDLATRPNTDPQSIPLAHQPTSKQLAGNNDERLKLTHFPLTRGSPYGST
jgi:hypothetical protein